MKTALLSATLVAGALCSSVVSAQEKYPPARAGKAMNMSKQMPQMQDNMKMMMEQMMEHEQLMQPMPAK